MTKPDKITLRGATVHLDWTARYSDSLGIASHSADSDALDEGTAQGPFDGEIFEIEGEKFHLGSHDYEPDGHGSTTCSAHIYAGDFQ